MNAEHSKLKNEINELEKELSIKKAQQHTIFISSLKEGVTLKYINGSTFYHILQINGDNAIIIKKDWLDEPEKIERNLNCFSEEDYIVIDDEIGSIIVDHYYLMLHIEKSKEEYEKTQYEIYTELCNIFEKKMERSND